MNQGADLVKTSARVGAVLAHPSKPTRLIGRTVGGWVSIFPPTVLIFGRKPPRALTVSSRRPIDSAVFSVCAGVYRTGERSADRSAGKPPPPDNPRARWAPGISVLSAAR